MVIKVWWFMSGQQLREKVWTGYQKWKFLVFCHRATHLSGSLLTGNQQKLLKYAKFCNSLKIIQCLLLNNYLLTINE